MLKHQVSSPAQALAYITDCTLATVCDMAMTKSRRKGEYKRQISIAQTAVDWMIVMGVDPSGTRAEKVAHHRGSVAEWAKSFEA